MTGLLGINKIYIDINAQKGGIHHTFPKSCQIILDFLTKGTEDLCYNT